MKEMITDPVIVEEVLESTAQKIVFTNSPLWVAKICKAFEEKRAITKTSVDELIKMHGLTPEDLYGIALTALCNSVNNNSDYAMTFLNNAMKEFLVNRRVVEIQKEKGTDTNE